MSDNLDNAMRVMADQSRQIDRLRAALVAAMEIVHNERRRITPYDGEPLPVRLCDIQRITQLNTIIAQADAALGRIGNAHPRRFVFLQRRDAAMGLTRPAEE